MRIVAFFLLVSFVCYGENCKEVFESHTAKGSVFAARKIGQKLKLGARRASGKSVNKFLNRIFRTTLDHSGKLYRKYISKTNPDSHNQWWETIENLHRNGDLSTSFGYPLVKGDVKVRSTLLPPEGINKLKSQYKTVGRDLNYKDEVFKIRKFRQSPMVNISGMSFPQISAQSILSLFYVHIKLLKNGIYTTMNTGAGGPKFHLMLLDGDREKFRSYVVEYAVRNKMFERGDSSHAKIEAFIDYLFDARDELFKEFGGSFKAQIVAQIHSALNGVRLENGKIDWEKVRELGKHPNVVMTQFLLKQAAKRGAMLKSSKVDPITAAMREIVPDMSNQDSYLKAPMVPPDLDSFENIASAIRKTKMVTGKPVSLKFGIGAVEDIYELFSYLKAESSLPDHIQIDGEGSAYSSGGGGSSFGSDTSLSAREGIILINAVLKKLGIRELIVVEASGEILLPNHGMELVSLGADSIAAARLYMNMALGCSMVKTCKDGNCPYGIAARSDSIYALGFDYKEIAAKGHRAAESWYKSFTLSLAEAGIDFSRSANELEKGVSKVEKFNDTSWDSISTIYAPERIKSLLNDVMTEEEVEKFVYGK